MKRRKTLISKCIMFATAFVSVVTLSSFNAGADTTANSTKAVTLKTSELKVDKVIVAPKKEVVTTSRRSSQESDTTTATNYTVNRGSASSSEVVNLAYSLLGKPYVYGATGPNAFDCSGLTSYVYSRLGVSIPRTSSSQFGVGQRVSKGDLQPGDLVFFNTNAYLGHVGIYIGGGEFIHAPRTGKPVMISSLSQGYFSDVYAGARRVM